MVKRDDLPEVTVLDAKTLVGSRRKLSSGLVKRKAKESRKPSQAGVLTRTQLLDAAERVFADHGYEGASLRDIAEAAGLHYSLSTYHYGTKAKLFDEVVSRRAIELEALRLEGLKRINPTSLSASETVRLLIEAYASPIIQARYGKSKQWHAYVRLMAGLVNEPRWAPMIRKHHDHCAQVYLERWRELLPEVDNDSLLNAFSFMVVTTLYVCSNTNRFGRWKKKGLSRENELKAIIDDFVHFVHAGFMSLANRR